MPNNDEKKVLLKVTDLKQWFPLKKTKLFQKEQEYVDSNREMIPLEGDIPSPVHPPKGCKFHTRCKYCTEICKHITPELVEMRPGHFVACHNPLGVEKDS